MQSLTKLSPIFILKKQIKWKAKLYLSALSSLIILQAIFIVLSLNQGFASEGYGQADLDVQFSIYSLDIHLLTAMLWAIITGLLFSTKGYRQDDLAIISSRTSSAIANSFVMILYSIVAVLILVSSYFIQIICLFMLQKDALIINQIIISPFILLVCFCSISFSGSVGLLIGYCFQGPRILKFAMTFLCIGFSVITIIYPNLINLQPFILLPNLVISAGLFLIAIICCSLTAWIARHSEVTS